MYGRKFRSIDRQLIGGEDTFLRLSRTDLKTETENETKEHVIMFYQSNIIQQK